MALSINYISSIAGLRHRHGGPGDVLVRSPDVLVQVPVARQGFQMLAVPLG